MYDIIFIILNYKTYNETIKIVDELLLFKKILSHIIVVDNASPNESFAELSNTFKDNQCVDVISSGENGGYAKGNNFGLRYAKKYNPKYVCIINNDVHFSEETISHLIQIYPQLPNAALIAPIQKLPNGTIAKFPQLSYPSFSSFLRSYSFLFSKPLHKYFSNTFFKNVQKVWYVPGAFLFVDYNVFERIGFFDERTFLFGEENFSAYKVKKNGFSNYIVIDDFYVHEHSKTISSEKSALQQYKMIFEGKLLFLKSCERFPRIKVLLLKMKFFTYCLELKICHFIKNIE